MIIDLQRRLHECGRIRIGQQVPTGNGKTRPEKLTTFRLTSPDRTKIANAARLYGGTPQEWDAPAGRQWEVVTEADSLPVMVPPSDMAFTQSYELWSGGGCKRRCDGMNEALSDGPCLCDPAARECDIHTRLSVMLRDLAGLGVWRLDTQGYYAALELQGAVEVVQLAAGRGHMLPARLRLEQRMTKRPGQGTRRFAVPVLDIEVSPAQLLGGQAAAMLGDGTPGTIAIESPRPAQRAIDNSAPLTPVPESVPERPAAPIAEQAAAVKERKPRKNAAQPVPRTGLAPRTAAQAARREPPTPDEPPPDDDPGPPPAAVNDDGPEGPATAPQYNIINKAFRDAGVTEADDKRAVVAHILGGAVDTMTVSEAHTVIKAFNNAKDLVKFCGDIVGTPITDPDGEPVDADEMVTDKQKTKLAIIRDERYGTSIEGRGRWFKWIGVQIGRQISSNTDMTKAEAMVVLDLLENDSAPEDSAPPEEGEQ